MNNYGKSVSIDLHGCNTVLFTRRHLKRFVKELCDFIDMKRAKLVFWDYGWHWWAKHKAPSHLKGVSLVQFIETSTITIHTLDDLEAVYIDLFSCGNFDSAEVIQFTEEWFNGCCLNHQSMERL